MLDYAAMRRNQDKKPDDNNSGVSQQLLFRKDDAIENRMDLIYKPFDNADPWSNSLAATALNINSFAENTLGDKTPLLTVTRVEKTD